MRPEARIDIFLDVLKKEWKKDPSLRFTQLLFNHGLVNTEEAYHEEELNLLQKMFPKIPPREYAIWGTYGKSGKGKLKYIKVKNIKIDHLESILKTVKRIKGTDWEKLIKAELKLKKKLAKTWDST